MCEYHRQATRKHSSLIEDWLYVTLLCTIEIDRLLLWNCCQRGCSFIRHKPSEVWIFHTRMQIEQHQRYPPLWQRNHIHLCARLRQLKFDYCQPHSHSCLKDILTCRTLMLYFYTTFITRTIDTKSMAAWLTFGVGLGFQKSRMRNHSKRFQCI